MYVKVCVPLSSSEDICERDTEVEGTSRKQALCPTIILHQPSPQEPGAGWQRVNRGRRGGRRAWGEVGVALAAPRDQARPNTFPNLCGVVPKAIFKLTLEFCLLPLLIWVGNQGTVLVLLLMDCAVLKGWKHVAHQEYWRLLGTVVGRHSGAAVTHWCLTAWRLY